MFLYAEYLLAYECDTEEFIKLPRKFVLFHKNVKQITNAKTKKTGKSHTPEKCER